MQTAGACYGDPIAIVPAAERIEPVIAAAAIEESTAIIVELYAAARCPIYYYPPSLILFYLYCRRYHKPKFLFPFKFIVKRLALVITIGANAGIYLTKIAVLFIFF
jgi:hypothetical protein